MILERNLKLNSVFRGAFIMSCRVSFVRDC